jgi:hypothetical protein
MDLMQFTATQIKWLIQNEAPELKGYKKKNKTLLIKIINDNNINTEPLESLVVTIPKAINSKPNFTVSFD